MTDYYTENLADFGRYDIETLRDLLTAWIEQGLPNGFYDSGVKPAMNKNSGNVFLVNDDYQVAMLNDDKLEIFHSLPYSGEEGFLTDLITENDAHSLHSEDYEYLVNAADLSDLKLPNDWLNI